MQRWFRQRCIDLYKGEIHKITLRLDHAGLPEHAYYFHTYRPKCNIKPGWKKAIPIGSGTVESGAKQFKGRLTGVGMRWSREAAQEILIICGAVMAQRFDARWNAAAA
jgi:hypothetical protein